MKFVLTIFLGASFLTLSAQENPYAEIEFDSLVIYDIEYIYRDEDGKRARVKTIVKSDGSVVRSSIKSSARLKKSEAEEFTNRLGNKDSFGLNSAACFDPHFAAIYYSKGKPAAHITICLSCNTYQPSQKIPASLVDREYDGEVYRVTSGFSLAYREYLNELKKKYGFHTVSEIDNPIYHVD